MAADYSKKLRSRGNQTYKEACSESLAPIVRSHRFIRASRFYRQALDGSRDEDERAKCSKNLGAVHWKHAQMCLELHDHGPGSSLLKERPPSYDIERSVEHYLVALRHGRASNQRVEWRESIESTLEEIVTSILEQHAWVGELGLLEKLSALFQTRLQPGSKSRAQELLHLGYVQALFDLAVLELKRKDQKGNYSKCLALLQRCHGPLEEMEKQASSESLEKARTLKLSVESCRATCESMQAREAGERFLQESWKARDEASRHDLVMSGLDKFKEAAILARGVDLHCEGEALACIGDLYREVLRKDHQAEPYYSMVVKLAQNSDTMQSASWYMRAKGAMNLFFKRRREGPKSSFSVLPEIKADLEKVEKEFKRLNTDEFLTYLYKAYPPRTNNGRSSLGELRNGAHSRIELRKALRHYHPDHNALGDDRWSALCGEITKLLLQKHRANAQA